VILSPVAEIPSSAALAFNNVDSNGRKSSATMPGHSLQSEEQVPCSWLIRSDFTICSPIANSFVVDAWVRNTNMCGVIRNTFVSTRSTAASIVRGAGAERIFNLPNAGGNSVMSEVLSCELMSALLGATLLRTEMEIEYMWHGCKITDYSMELCGQATGVSVTRALKFNGVFTEEDAVHLLKKKLDGVNASTRCVLPEHGWSKQILHVFTEQEYIAEIVARVYHKMSQELKSNTLVMLTVTKNASFVFF